MPASVKRPLSVNSTSRTEKMVFDLAAALDSEWHVWMNQKLNFFYENYGAMNREVDCILYHKFYGMLLIECKDGFITRHVDHKTGEVVWQQNGDVLDPGPHEQAMSLTPPLHDFLKYYFKSESDRGTSIRIQWAVCFGDMNSAKNIPQNEIPRQRIFLKSDLENVDAFLKRVKEILYIKEASHGNNPFPNVPLEDDDLERLCEFFGGYSKNEEAVSLPDLWDLENKSRVQPTLTQEMLMESIQRNPKLRVEGVAGSGKSMLVMWEAMRLAKMEKRVAVICYNELLADSFEKTFKENGLDKFVEIHNYAKWCQKYVKLAKVSGVPHKAPKTDVDVYYNESLPAAFGMALEKMHKDKKLQKRLFDAVIVDEGQDWMASWIEPAFKLLADSNKGIVRYFYDPRQKMYAGRDWYNNDFLNQMPVIVLGRGYRSTKNILEWVRCVTGVSVPTYADTPLGDKPEVLLYKKPEDQIAMLDKCVAKLEKRKVKRSDILVVSVRSQRKSSLQNLDDTKYNWTVTGDKGLSDHLINVVSAHRIKGLDAPVVILTDVARSTKAPNEPHSMSDIIFVGATRAKSKLIVFREK